MKKTAKKSVVRWVCIIVAVILALAAAAMFIFSRMMRNMMGGEVELSYTHEMHQVESGGSTVYMTTEISPEAMQRIYEALGTTVTGDNIAVKLSTGEPPASNYLDPALIKDLVQSVDGTIVECNTAYGGSRSETAMHYQVAEDHGFTRGGNLETVLIS